MGSGNRQHTRYKVRLGVSYPNAAEFVSDYVENLSIGGLFIAGAQHLEVFQETEVQVDLPNHGTWRVRATVVFIYDKATAEKMGRRPGAGLQITHKQNGYDDALFGYLVRLGRRREVAVMVGDVPGKAEIADNGYHVIPLVEGEAFNRAIDTAVVPIIAVVVPPPLFANYDARARIAGMGGGVFVIANRAEVSDALARIDGLL